MKIGIRFSPPVPEELDYILFKETFGDSLNIVNEILESAPLEISLLACLIRRIEESIN